MPSSCLVVPVMRINKSVRCCKGNGRERQHTSIDSFIAGFELAWKLSIELNHYENERSVSCRTAMGLRARFASEREEEK